MNDRPRLMALVFALRLTVLGVIMLAVALGLFFLGLTEEQEWESLFVMFSVFVLMVSYVLLFIRMSHHRHRVLLLTPLLALVLPGPKFVFGGLWVTGIAVLEALRRESECLVWFLGAQLMLVIGGLGLLFIPSRPLLLGLFWIVAVLVPLALAIGCWVWQMEIKRTLVRHDVDDE